MYLSDIMLSLSFLNVSVLWCFFDSLWQLDAYIFTDLGNLVWIWRDYCNIGIKDCVFRPPEDNWNYFCAASGGLAAGREENQFREQKERKKREMSEEERQGGQNQTVFTKNSNSERLVCCWCEQ